MKNLFLKTLLLLVILIPLSACTGDGSGDSEELQACLDGCGEPTGVGRDAPCGEDGWLYPSQCRMDCYGVEVAPDPLYCASPAVEVECDDEHIGYGRVSYYPCGVEHVIQCYDPQDGWMENAIGACPSGANNDCIQACPACPADDADFVCGKSGVRYCNECVMACLEDELAEDQSSCSAEAVFADFCDSSVDTNATRIGLDNDNYEDYGCNSCTCENNIWHCTFWACPGNYEEL